MHCVTVDLACGHTFHNLSTHPPLHPLFLPEPHTIRLDPFPPSTTTRSALAPQRVHNSSRPNLDEGSYYTPVDRIGGAYTPSALSLTMAHAQQVSKTLMYGNPVGGPHRDSGKSQAQRAREFGKTRGVTAPIAFDSTLERSRMDPPPLPQTGAGLGLSLPEQTSPNARRDAARGERSPSKNKFLEGKGGKAQGFEESRYDAFDNWDPMVLDNLDKQNVVERTADEEAMAQIKSVELYWAAVDSKVESGTLNAAGSGQRSVLPDVPLQQLNGINLRLAPPLPKVERDPENDMELIEAQLVEVRNDYLRSGGRAVVDYELKDDANCERLGIEIDHLNAGPGWWLSEEYMAPEWRVLRSTDVPNSNVHRAFVIMSRRLCVTETVMLELQQLWLEGTLLFDYNNNNENNTAGDTSTAGSGAMDGSPGAAGGGKEPVCFSGLLFTDVNTPFFRQRLPLALDMFTSHIERKANSVRDTLKEHWVQAASTKLTSALQVMREENSFEEDDEQAPPPDYENDDNPLGVNAADYANDEDAEFDDWYNEHYGNEDGGASAAGGAAITGDPAADALVRKRLATDGLYPPGSGGGGGADDAEYNDINAGSMTEKSVVAAASMLMSRQLRSSCEESLMAFAAFFKRFANEAASGDSAFKLQLKLNEDYTRGTPDSNTPLVVIEPSMDRLKQQVRANSVSTTPPAPSYFATRPFLLAPTTILYPALPGLHVHRSDRQGHAKVPARREWS